MRNKETPALFRHCYFVLVLFVFLDTVILDHCYRESKLIVTSLIFQAVFPLCKENQKISSPVLERNKYNTEKMKDFKLVNDSVKSLTQVTYLLWVLTKNFLWDCRTLEFFFLMLRQHIKKKRVLFCQQRSVKLKL